jgi:hypothetical protein
MNKKIAEVLRVSLRTNEEPSNNIICLFLYKWSETPSWWERMINPPKSENEWHFQQLGESDG